MSVSESFRTFVLEQMSRVAAPVRAKSMFGGVGIYSDNIFFAIIADDELYLKVDESNRPDFEALGLGPFRPFGPEGEAMQYYLLPADVLEDSESLRVWAQKSIAVGQRKLAKSRRRGKA